MFITLYGTGCIRHLAIRVWSIVYLYLGLPEPRIDRQFAPHFLYVLIFLRGSGRRTNIAMEKIKLLEITPIYPEVFNGGMVGYLGTIEDTNCSKIKRTVLFLCNPSGSEVSARVPNTRISFQFCDNQLNVSELTPNLEIDVEQHQIEVGKEHENYLTLIETK